MEPREGGEKVFPSDLMIARKTKTGIIYPVFLSDDNIDYARAVISAFTENTGKKKEVIENNLKEIELKFQNAKIIRALSLIMMRKSIFVPPVNIDAQALREYIFSMARIPPINSNEREMILKSAAESFNIDYIDIENAIYADKDSESILERPYNTDEGKLIREYNLEQLETVLLKCTELNISNASDWHFVITRIRRLGLLYEIKNDGDKIISVNITGPMALFENTERYGSKFSMLIRSIYKMNEWSLTASIKVKDFSGDKNIYTLKLSDSAKFFLPSGTIKPEHLPEHVSRGYPIIINNKFYFPDYIIDLDERIYVSINSDERPDNLNWINVYILSDRDKKKPGSIAFYNDMDWDELFNLISKKRNLSSEIDNYSIDEIKKKLDQIYPDSQGMIDYLESQGLIPLRVLPELGYKIKWKNLDIIIEKA